MIFACILALMGIVVFAFSENPISLLIVVAAIGLATREYEDLKQKVEWLEIKLEKSDKNAR